MEIVFLGTGGGRINLIKQIRATGGIRINSKSANIHIDPGPGALIHSIKNKQDPLKLDCIIVTHNHTDHVSDAQVLSEAMTGYCLKKKGVLIASENVFSEKGISDWHISRIGEAYHARFGERKKFQTPKGSFEIEIIQMKHEDPSTFGFKLFIDGKVIGHISDTEYLEGMGEAFSGCDCLIINVIKPEKDKYAGHLTCDQEIDVLKKAMPRQAVITHLGMKMLRIGPQKEAQRIEKASGVKTSAAKDGWKLGV
jgi:phosphoribosyl 1,2-cyclic phosphodiesterase